MDELVREILGRMSPIELVMLEQVGVQLPSNLSRLADHCRSQPSPPPVDRIARWIAFNSAWLAKEFAREETKNRFYRQRGRRTRRAA